MASSKQTEKEHDNYNRYTRLLQDVAPKVLRKLFETRALSLKQVSSIDLFLAESNVKNTLQQYLVKIRVLRQHQLDLLYPPDGSAVKMDDWDITLLCTLLKNTCKLVPQELASVEKIRNIRNSTSGHKSGASLSNQDFTSYWSDLWSAIDDVLKAINDEAFHNDINKLESFIQHDKDTDLLDTIVDTWLKDEEKFVETQACRNIQQRLESMPIITIGGISGSGKSGIAHHVALKLSKQGYAIYPVTRAEDIEKYANIKERQVFVLDDPVGKHNLDLNELQQFEKIHQNIMSLTKDDIKLILTCRKNILNDEQFNSYETVVGHEIVDLSSEENRLAEEEKKRMFDMYASTAKLSATEKESILRETHTRFPLLCKVFGANLDKFERQAVHFFSEPFTVLLEEVKTIKQRDKYHYCSLLLCLIFQNSFDVDILNGVPETFETREHKVIEIMNMCGLSKEEPMTKIELAFKSLIGVYFIQEDTRFRFMHDALFDVVAYQFGTDHPCEMLKYCSSSFIREYVRTEDALTGDEHVVRIRQKHYIVLTNRFYSDLSNGDFHDVFLNPSLRDQRFIKTFCSYTKTMKRDDLVNVYFRTCSNLEGFKSSRSNSKQRWHKDWFIKLFLQEINARAIHWVMAYNHFEIFCACRSVAKTFKIRLDKINTLNKFKSLFGKKTNQQRHDEETMVLMACLSGNVNMFNTVLQDNPNVDLTAVLDWYEPNAMHMATISGDIELVGLLIKKGIDVNARDCRDVTPLFISAAMGHLNICTRIIQDGGNVNETSRTGSSPLFIAAQEGHIETAAALLKQGADVNMCKRNGSSPLLAAAGKGHVEAVRLLLEQGADVNQTNDNGIFPLYEAAREGHTEIVHLLLQRDAFVNKTTETGNSPLHEAVIKGNTNIARLLLQREASVNEEVSLLHVAARQGSADILTLLLQHGAHLSWCHNKGLSPLYAAAYGGHSECVSVLLQHGANANLCHSNGFTPLHIAALKGNKQTVSKFLQNGADLNRLTKYRFSSQKTEISVEKVIPQPIPYSRNDGVSPLYLAVLVGNAETANVLLENKADEELTNNESESLLYIAAREGHTDTVAVLLQHGADINHCQSNGFSPLYIAAMKGRTETADMLLQRGADINQCDSDGDSPLHVAAMNGHTGTVSVLLKHKADINLCPGGGFSPLYAAACQGKARTVSVLLKYGADINLGNDGGDTPLYRAIQQGKTETVSVLLQGNADVNQHSSAGITPLIAASKAGNVDIVEALLRSGSEVNMKAIDTGETALVEAAKKGCLDVIEALLGSGADVNIATSDTGSTALMETVKAGYLDVVEALLISGADVNMKAIDTGRTALLEAVKAGYLDVLEALLASRADVNITSNTGRTALMEAVKYGCLDLLKSLLASGANTAIVAIDTGQTVLMEAAKHGYLYVVETLLASGADVNVQATNTGRTALMEAAKSRHIPVLKTLLASAANTDIRAIDTGRTALLEAAVNGYLDVVEALLGSGANLDITAIATGRTALIEASKYGHLDIVKALLDSGADMNVTASDTGQSALIEAARYGFLDIAKALQDAGADMNIKSLNTGRTALMEAATYGFSDIVDALTTTSSDVNTVNK